MHGHVYNYIYIHILKLIYRWKHSSGNSKYWENAIQATTETVSEYQHVFFEANISSIMISQPPPDFRSFLFARQVHFI
jgi:hypothetical protein